jgi:RHS repeat-associated protein
MFAVTGAKRCSGHGARHATRNGGRPSNQPKGASATSPVSGTGNVATNNQDANNTGSNGNTAPPAAPTAKVNVEVFYVHPDHLGTPRVITASTALAATTGTGITSPQTVNKAVWRWDSDPFGSNATANSAPNENPNTLSQVVGTSTLPYLFGFDLAFPGQKRDRETGKHYNYFRDYDPSVGRYFESDPIGLRGGISTFGYVGQAPSSAYDPRGLEIVPGGPDVGPGIPVVEICIRPPSQLQPVPHGFLCVDGDRIGFYPRPGENPVWPNPGEWRDDSGERSRSICTPTPRPYGCRSYFTNCVATCSKPGPRRYPYSIGGLTCLDRADSCLQTCRLACAGRKK